MMSRLIKRTRGSRIEKVIMRIKGKKGIPKTKPEANPNIWAMMSVLSPWLNRRTRVIPAGIGSIDLKEKL